MRSAPSFRSGGWRRLLGLVIPVLQLPAPSLIGLYLAPILIVSVCPCGSVTVLMNIGRGLDLWWSVLSRVDCLGNFLLFFSWSPISTPLAWSRESLSCMVGFGLIQFGSCRSVVM